MLGFKVNKCFDQKAVGIS